MYLTTARAWRFAVGAPLERGVRHHSAGEEDELFNCPIVLGPDRQLSKRAVKRRKIDTLAQSFGDCLYFIFRREVVLASHRSYFGKQIRAGLKGHGEFFNIPVLK